MRLTTIWTMPAMSLTERLRRTIDLAAITTAARLPQRVRYWTFIQVGVKAMLDDEVVGSQHFFDLLERTPTGWPRS